MKYLIIGAGGTGGGIGAFLTRAGKDATLIARGKHLHAMQENGLRLIMPDSEFCVPVKVCTMEEYQDTPDVIFVCVKGYSLEDTIPFIRRIAKADTVVIPILNIYGTGKKMQDQLTGIAVMDGCIYIAAEIKEPGSILMSGNIFRIVYGPRQETSKDVKAAVMPTLMHIEQDLKESGITPLLSEQIEKDALQKFSFVSPMAACGAFYNAQAFAFQMKGQFRNTFISLIEEVKAISDAMDLSLPENIVEINLKIMDDLAPTATASMHRDIRDGKQSELDGLVFEVLRLGKKYHVPTPVYEMIAEKFNIGTEK